MFKIPFDRTSLLLYGCYWMINLTISLASFDLKIIVEILGSLAGASTIFYNGIRTIGEIKKFFNSKKEKKWPKVKDDEVDEEKL